MEADLLRRLARFPLADRLDLVYLSGWSRGSVYEGIGRLGAYGLVSSVPHATALLPPTRRFHVTEARVARPVQAGRDERRSPPEATIRCRTVGCGYSLRGSIPSR